MNYKNGFTLFVYLGIFALTVLMPLSAEDKSITEIDALHRLVSQKVLEYSEAIDIYLSDKLSFLSPEIRECNITIKSNDTKDQSDQIDRFFQNERYFLTTDDVFIQIRTSGFFNKTQNRYSASLRAQIPFRRCRERWRLYFEDEKTDIPTASGSIKNDIGIRYFQMLTKGIQARYSVGLSDGIYLRALFSKRFQISNWTFEPIQSLRYSAKKGFEEESSFYFDTFLSPKSVFQIWMYRKTGKITEGTDYALVMNLFRSGKDNRSGWRFTQGFYGNTRYKMLPRGDIYKGISRYESVFAYRSAFLKKWIYVEVSPALRFEKRARYRRDFALRVTFDFYFGKTERN